MSVTELNRLPDGEFAQITTETLDARSTDASALFAYGGIVLETEDGETVEVLPEQPSTDDSIVRFDGHLLSVTDDDNTETKLWDNTNRYIPQASLENDDITLSAGHAIQSLGSVSLGGSQSVAVDATALAGKGLNAGAVTNELTTDQITSQNVTATGGSSSAVDTTISTSLLDTQHYDVLVSVASTPSFSADYAFTWDYDHIWDDANSEVQIGLTVEWVTDPGSGNDVDLFVEIIQR